MLALILSLTFAGACGGDDDNAADTAATSDSNGGGAVGPFSSARCAQAAGGLASAAAAVPQAFTGGATDLDAAVKPLEEAADDAPSEIRDDLQKVAAGYRNIAEALEGANFNPASGQPPSEETTEKLEQASNEIEASDFQAALERVGKWFEEECGR
jgi:hypothetical protein